MYGVRSTIHFSAWVIPARYMEKATRALMDAGYVSCQSDRRNRRDRRAPRAPGCSKMTEHYHPYPDKHFHHRKDAITGEKKELVYTVALYKMNRLFWNIPEPPFVTLSSAHSAHSSCFNGSDFQRSRQREGDYPIRLLTPGQYLQGMIYLVLRDHHAQRFKRWQHWQQELGYLVALFGQKRYQVHLKGLDARFLEYMKHRSSPEYGYRDSGARLLNQIFDEEKKGGRLPKPENGETDTPRLDQLFQVV
ncbi:hypothetical protein ASPCADRAFT_508825 [Aspergillus carbonarius ITEM 5010]|uniref:Uncharacterized protein n=1 Tax=Aspergillus carbonarius (strain ITEM 5010) TaxID=602072 RepID=A0A1R3REW8_ASPC5|nr:hypothetical protein ASPCADRAFT_508825 [Aspergillus carbonarius ITEM 5010]